MFTYSKLFLLTFVVLLVLSFVGQNEVSASPAPVAAPCDEEEPKEKPKEKPKKEPKKKPKGKPKPEKVLKDVEDTFTDTMGMLW